MPHYVVTVFGPDRPGIIAEVTAALGSTGANLEDSTMTILRGRLAMMLVIAAPVELAQVEAALAQLPDHTLQVAVREVTAEGQQDPATNLLYTLSVHGGDRPGIVSTIAALVAQAGGNITDLSTRLIGELYVLLADVSLPAQTDIDALSFDLSRTATELGVEAGLRRADTDLL